MFNLTTVSSQRSLTSGPCVYDPLYSGLNGDIRRAFFSLFKFQYFPEALTIPASTARHKHTVRAFFNRWNALRHVTHLLNGSLSFFVSIILDTTLVKHSCGVSKTWQSVMLYSVMCAHPLPWAFLSRKMCSRHIHPLLQPVEEGEKNS